jgi:hypothetical protein
MESLPETAMVSDNLGIWPVDIDEAFALYRKGHYRYNGISRISGSNVHIFVLLNDKCE